MCPQFAAPGCDLVADLDQLLIRVSQEDEIMIIGGASFYQQLLPMTDRLYLTKIHEVFDGDTWFPRLEANEWEEIMREDCVPDGKNHYRYSFITYARKA